MKTRAKPTTKPSARKTDDCVPIRASRSHHAALSEMARRNRWTIKAAAEMAIEELARRHGIEIRSGGPVLKEGAAA